MICDVSAVIRLCLLAFAVGAAAGLSFAIWMIERGWSIYVRREKRK